jgi:hypothetical protein
MQAISRSWKRIGRLGTPAAIGAALLLGAPSGAAAQVDGDLRVGVYTDASEAFVGGGVLIRLDQGSKWFLNPNLEYVFVERGDLLTFNADFHYDLASDGSTDFWLGGGPTLILRDNERGDDETDFGFNLLGGIGFLRSSAVRPFLQAKLILSDETEGVFAFGIRF